MAVVISGTAGINTPGLESAAMPTVGGDAVVESGSNSDGNWQKIADGVLECWGESPNLEVVQGQVKVKGATLSFPMPFLEIPVTEATQSAGHGDLDAGAASCFLNSDAILTNSQYRPAARLWTVIGSTISVRVHWKAKGRWK